MNYQQLTKYFLEENCNTVYIKELSPNDNSKNQVYFGGSFEVLNIFPLSEIITEPAGDWKKERFKAKIEFFWLNSEGNKFRAPYSQIVLYPKYPEVRFSGFLSGTEWSPSDLLTKRDNGRILFLGVNDKRQTIGYICSSDSVLAREYHTIKCTERISVFNVHRLNTYGNSKIELIKTFKRIHNLGWIKSKRLNSAGEFIDCESPQCGGYTLEAELGIIPNGLSMPDFLGWEIKSYGVRSINKIGGSPITLMTPEPNGGFYSRYGVKEFLFKYGYDDKRGVKDRKNFGGVHKFGKTNKTTNLTMHLIGFDFSTSKIRNTDGRIALIDNNGEEAASWLFSSLLTHWNKKHHQACFVPTIRRLSPYREYQYGSNILLGMGTDFILFLIHFAEGKIYYDPGIKVENISSKPHVKPRSQFRIKSSEVRTLYKDSEIINLDE